MFSPNQLYDYLRYYCYTKKKNTVVRNFIINGSKDLKHLTHCDNIYTGHKETQTHTNTGFIEMLDQEPVDVHAFYQVSKKTLCNEEPKAFRLQFNVNDFVFSKSMALFTPIVVHSEHNSCDIKLYKDNFFNTAHFWSNAFTSRYWYTQYELLTPHYQSNSQKRFGTYIRDTSGTRSYRKKLLKFLRNNIKDNIFCPLIDTNTKVSSNASATIEWPDHNQFNIQIVPETLFDTEKTHLTEKIFKAVVMGHPFILFAGPNSLEYLKSYGFRTFSTIWDESYDLEINANLRFDKLTTLIKNINYMNDHNFNKLITKVQKIAEFNRKHFFSEVFKKKLIHELHNNLDNALLQQKEDFHSMPGGTLFYYHDLFFKQTNKHLNNENLISALQYTKTKSNKVYQQIIKKYKHLL